MTDWSIGIYTGESPFRLAPPPGRPNPVLTRADVTDLRAAFVADPFMIEVAGRWHLFFEALDADTQQGVIALATSRDGFAWRYRGVVLREPFHLSYPYVFEHAGQFYMTPETLTPEAIRLYRAVSFPDRWEPATTLLELKGADPSVCFFEGRWWLFVCAPMDRHDTLRLYHADALSGPWHEHPGSPVVAEDPHTARPAGRLVVHNGTVVRYAQTCTPRYGLRVRAFEITTLTPTAYAETEHPESPVLEGSGSGWNGGRMHHVDPHLRADGSWIACVDGRPREVQP